MKFYMTPGSCSTGIHILLEETGVQFEAYLVDLIAGEQHQPTYRALNPKGTVPTLVLDDGSALTDFQSIAWWLARSFPKRRLLPVEPANEARVIELMNHAVVTLHGEGFARLFVSETFSDNPAEQDAIRRKGREIVEQGFALLDGWLTGKAWAMGEFGIADAALFYVEFWADRTEQPLPANCRAHYERMLQRPAVRQVLLEEGYARVVNEHKR